MAQVLRDLGWSQADIDDHLSRNGELPGPLPTIDWATFWDRERTKSDFLVEPVIARGRQHALYASQKEGKSLLLGNISARLATGLPILSSAPADPINVLYLDYEMTDDDVEERLVDFGFDRKSDLARLHYSLYPPLPSLDTPQCGEHLLYEVARLGIEFVVIDTFSKAVQGEENSADTYRDFARYTGLGLRKLGVTLTRSDQAGKDKERGQRGSSAKADDVDVVWRLDKADETTFNLTATHSRVPWIPRKVQLTQTSTHGFELAVKKTPWPAGTRECAADLDALGIPLDASTRDAQAALK